LAKCLIESSLLLIPVLTIDETLYTIMKNLLVTIIVLLIFNISFAQKSETELLKNYDFYVEKNIEMGKWRTKYYLSNGLISVQENYWKNKLRSRTEFQYGRFGNVKREINTYDINEGNVNDISNIKLEYNDSSFDPYKTRVIF
jgi:hypothetical protein